MIIANKLLPQARGLAPALLKRAATVSLDWATRSKSRFDAVDSQGRHLGVFLPRGSTLRGGDALVAEDGSLLRVEATPEQVLRVHAHPSQGTTAALALLRAAYHLGNRHVAVELQASALQLEPDPVLAEMLRRQGLVVDEVLAPFEPEGGAYAAGAGGHGHGHEHVNMHASAHASELGHQHGHAHAQEHHHGHGAHSQTEAPVHVHGPGCDHNH